MTCDADSLGAMVETASSSMPSLSGSTTAFGLRVLLAALVGGAGVTSLSLGASAYGFGGIGACCELEVAFRSLLGGALTVRRRPGLLPLVERSTDAEAAGLTAGLWRVLVRVLYGCAALLWSCSRYGYEGSDVAVVLAGHGTQMHWRLPAECSLAKPISHMPRGVPAPRCASSRIARPAFCVRSPSFAQ